MPYGYVNSADGVCTIVCCVVGRVLHIISVRSLRVCSFNSNGQYQSLRTWDGQQVPASRFSFLIHLLTPKRKPGGNQNSFNHEEIL